MFSKVPIPRVSWGTTQEHGRDVPANLTRTVPRWVDSVTRTRHFRVNSKLRPSHAGLSTQLGNTPRLVRVTARLGQKNFLNLFFFFAHKSDTHNRVTYRKWTTLSPTDKSSRRRVWGFHGRRRSRGAFENGEVLFFFTFTFESEVQKVIVNHETRFRRVQNLHFFVRFLVWE